MIPPSLYVSTGGPTDFYILAIEPIVILTLVVLVVWLVSRKRK